LAIYIATNLPLYNSALLTFTPTAIGGTGPKTETLQVSEGALTFNLGATPVYIEEAP
jgi:hypothetical protein